MLCSSVPLTRPLLMQRHIGTIHLERCLFRLRLSRFNFLLKDSLTSATSQRFYSCALKAEQEWDEKQG